MLEIENYQLCKYAKVFKNTIACNYGIIDGVVRIRLCPNDALKDEVGDYYCYILQTKENKEELCEK